MKIAIIGLGHVAKFQLDAISRINEIELVAAHDIDPQQSVSLPSSTRFFVTLDELLSDSNADIFMVSTPNVTHYEVGKRVIESDRAVLLEKPCCNTMGELDNLVDTAQRNGRFFAVALHAMYARDLLWYLGRVKAGDLDFGALTGFYAGFFDPYYQSGEIVPAALGLGGSWFDSGINALSVIGRLIEPQMLSLVEGRMTVINSLPCSEVQGAATFKYSNGHGIIDTNWTLGINRKVTRLYYSSSNTEVILNHSDESVLIIRGDEAILKKDLRNGLPRLTNHYVNLFRDIRNRFHEAKNNIGYAVPLHNLLFLAGSHDKEK